MRFEARTSGRYCSDACRRRAAKERQVAWAAANHDRNAATKRRYVERHPERRAEQARRAWQKLRADPERYARFLRQSRESYARHPETAYLYALSWRSANRDALRARNRLESVERRARMGKSNPEVNEFVPVLRADPCAYCGEAGSVIDHIVPLAEGGEHDVSNLTGACRSCNARKRTRSLLRFLLARFVDELDHEHAIALAQQHHVKATKS